MPHLRRKLYAAELPPVHLQIAYESKEDGEITVVDAESTPISRFPPSTHRRIYDIAYVKVIRSVGLPDQTFFILTILDF